MRRDPADLTVMVFKDNLAARTFRVPLAWFSRAGFAMLAAAFCLFAITYTSIRNYQTVLKVNPGRLQDLEHQVSELQSQLESRNRGATPSEQDTTSGAAHPLLFTAFPEGVNFPPPPRESLAISISRPTVGWRERKLEVRFNINYIKSDGANQQGHLIVLARSRDSIAGYPEGTLNPPSERSLLTPKNGEYFSVSRFREVYADFGPFATKAEVDSVEIFLFDLRPQPLLHEVVHLKESAVGNDR